MDDLRFVHILMRAELDAVICSGARRGKQFTYALLEERAPQAKPLSRDEALAELTQRYFTSHGPATIQDFVWWSGLTMADARTGLDAVQSALVRETIDSRTYWQSASTPDSYEQRSSPTAYLLPAYDEYLVSYKDRSASVYAEHSKASDRRNSILNPTIVIEGQVVGMWQRTLKKRDVTITSDLFTALDADQTRVFAEAVQRYAGFLDARIVEG